MTWDIGGPAPRRRRRRELIIVGGIGAVAVLVALGLVLLNGGGSTPTPRATGPTRSAGPTPSEVAGQPVVFRHDGRRAPSDLDEATITVPAFSLDRCPSGKLQFHAGMVADPAKASFGTTITGVAVGDVTGDGRQEHVAVFSCREQSGPGYSAQQVVALAASAGGAYTSLGVVYTVPTGVTIDDVQVNPAKAVQILTEPAMAGKTRTSRTFQWTGSGFATGKTSTVAKPVGPTKLRISVRPTSLKLKSGTGKLTYNVTDQGGAASSHVLISVQSSMPLTLTVPDASAPLTRGTAGAVNYWYFVIASPPANATVTGTITVTVDPAVPTTLHSAQVTMSASGVDIATAMTNDGRASTSLIVTRT
jgi:hypothetical protein